MPDTAEPPPRLGRCLNIKRCSLADTNAHIPLADDAPLSCPECHHDIVVRPPPGKAQVAVEERPRTPPRRLILLGSFVAVAIGAGVAFDLFATEEADDAPEAMEMVPEADTLSDPAVITKVTGRIMMFTLGATPDTRDSLAPALATAFMAEQGCEGFAERKMAAGRLRLSCTKGSLRYFIDIAPADAATAFDAGPRRPIDLLLSTSAAGGGPPRDPTILGFAAAAVIVNPSNPLRRLSVGEAASVWTGRIDNFRDVGGRDAAIRRIAPGDADRAVMTFAALAADGGTLAESTRRLGDSAAVAAAVAGDPDAIGLVGPLDAGGARTLAIGDAKAAVLPSADAIAKGRYPLAQTLRLELPRGSKVRFARPFIAFAASSAGQVHVRSAGYLPLPPAGVGAAAAGSAPPAAP